MDKMDMERLDKEDPPKKVYTILGRDVSRVPCFRESWIYGITGGIGSTIFTFMLTSRTQLASHVLVGSTTGIALVYFTYCRYNYARDEALAQQLKGLMNDPLTLKDPEELIKKSEELSKTQASGHEKEIQKFIVRH